MDTTTINGLHSCKPGNDPVVGQIKTFVVQQLTGKSGKPYLKIRSKSVEDGGTPHRILSAEKTKFIDQHGNVSYNLEIEATSMQPSAFQQTKAVMQRDDPLDYPNSPDRDEPETDPYPNAKPYPSAMTDDRPAYPNKPPQSPVHAQQGEDGVTATRKHLMQSANLLVLCIRAVENAVAPHQPVVAQTSEQFQSDVAKLFIEASSRRTTDGVNWWSFIDRMPTTPLVPNGKHSTTAKPIQKTCTCDNTDGDNPLCPIHAL